MFFNNLNKGNKKKRIISRIISSVFIVFLSFGIVSGCGPSNPSEAPFGSTITLSLVPEGLNLCGISLEPSLIRAVVTNAEGSPLNDVIVSFDVSFAGDNSLIIDTDGNNLGDSAILQLVDNSACAPFECLQTPLDQWFSFGALQTSPMDVLTDNFGVAEAVILAAGFANRFNDTGQIICAETTISAFSGTAAITQDFDLNTDCEIVIIDPDGEEQTISCDV